MSSVPTDVSAYKQGFERGYSLCMAMKKLSREFSATLRSVASKTFSMSYGQGLQDGYQEGFRNIKKELVNQKLQERIEAAEQTPPQNTQTKVQQRQSEVARMNTNGQQKENEQER